jgi:hypothetical protein
MISVNALCTHEEFTMNSSGTYDLAVGDNLQNVYMSV